MTIEAGFKTRGSCGLKAFPFHKSFPSRVLVAAACPPHSADDEPDFSGVPTHQGPRLAVWDSAFHQHRGSGHWQIFYFTDNNQTGVPAWLHEAGEKISKQKVHINI